MMNEHSSVYIYLYLYAYMNAYSQRHTHAHTTHTNKFYSSGNVTCVVRRRLMWRITYNCTLHFCLFVYLPLLLLLSLFLLLFSYGFCCFVFVVDVAAPAAAATAPFHLQHVKLLLGLVSIKFAVSLIVILSAMLCSQQYCFYCTAC